MYTSPLFTIAMFPTGQPHRRCADCWGYGCRSDAGYMYPLTRGRGAALVNQGHGNRGVRHGRLSVRVPSLHATGVFQYEYHRCMRPWHAP